MKHLEEINHGGYPKYTFAKGLWLTTTVIAKHHLFDKISKN
jgi:hypothetical protein